MPEGLADDAAANQAMADATAQGLLVREQQEVFPFHYYWDSPAEMQKYVEEEWTDWLGIEESVWKEVRSKWAVADADARVRIQVDMLITRWRTAP